MIRHAAVYCRLSPRPDGTYEGVEAQERWGRDYAASAWPDVPVEVFADKGISAANGDERPEYERFRAWLAAGRIAHVWCVEQSRLERREVEWFTLAAELDATGIAEIHTNRDGVVRVRDEVAGIKAVLAAAEVRKLTKRTNDTLDENAAAGQPPGSKPFGYVHGRNAEGVKTYLIVPEQAEVIRDAAAKVLAGWSLTNIAAELDARGVRGGHGGRITAVTVKQFLRAPSVAGWRVHRGRVVGRGNWVPILDEATWRAVVERLRDPRVVHKSNGGTYPIGVTPRGPAGRRYELTGGLAVCGVCGRPLVGAVKTMKKGVRRPYLMCHPVKGGGGCVGIGLLETEAYVRETLFAELDKPEFLAQLGADDHQRDRERILAALADLERQRNQLAELWATPGELTAAEWRTARRALAEHEGKLRQQLATIPPTLMHVDITAVRAAWPSMTLDERREFLRLFVGRVTVNRAKPGTRGFDPDRVAIEWQRL